MGIKSARNDAPSGNRENIYCLARIPNVVSSRSIKLERNIKRRVTSVRSSGGRRISRGPP